MEQDSGTGAAGAAGLAGYLVGFREELARSGYGPVRVGAQLELFADLCWWLGHEGVVLSELGSDRVGVFLADRLRRGRTDLVSRTGAGVLLGYLARVGAIPGQGFVIPEGPCRGLLERYRHYLETERGSRRRPWSVTSGWRAAWPAPWSVAGRSTGNVSGPGTSRDFSWTAVR